MKRWVPISLVLTALAAPLGAQGLRDKIADLFIFGQGEAPLFLAGTAEPNNPTVVPAHGAHFVPSSTYVLPGRT